MSAFEVRRGQVVENQSSFGQMSVRQRRFDRGLTFPQPIHSAIEFVFSGGLQAQGCAQAAAERVGMERPRGSQFGTGVNNAGGNHRDRQITRMAGGGVDDRVQSKLAEGTDHGGDMAVGKGAQDLERVGGRANRGSAFENLAQSCDLLGRPV